LVVLCFVLVHAMLYWLLYVLF